MVTMSETVLLVELVPDLVDLYAQVRERSEAQPVRTLPKDAFIRCVRHAERSASPSASVRRASLVEDGDGQ